MWEKIFAKTEIPILLLHKFFSTSAIFRKTEGFPAKFFVWVLWHRNISEKPWCPFPCMDFFDTRLFLKNIMVRLWNFSIMWEKKFTETMTPPSYPWIFLIPNKIWKIGGFHKEIFPHCETRNVPTEHREIPPSPWMFSRPEKFCAAEGSLTNFPFWSCATKKIDKFVMPPTLLDDFRYQTFFGIQRGSPMKFFGTVRKNFRRNRDTPQL